MRPWIPTAALMVFLCASVLPAAWGDDFQDRMWQRYQEGDHTQPPANAPLGTPRQVQAMVLSVSAAEGMVTVTTTHPTSGERMVLVFTTTAAITRGDTGESMALTDLRPGDIVLVHGLTGAKGLVVQNASLQRTSAPPKP